MMLKIIMLMLLLCCHGAFSKNSILSLTVGANLFIPTCTLTAPVDVNFGNISGSEFLNGNPDLRVRTFDITASCQQNVSRVELMLIPQNGVAGGRNNVALTSNSSVGYNVSLIGLGFYNVNFNSNIVWPSPATTNIVMSLLANGTLRKGVFNTAMTIQLTYT